MILALFGAGAIGREFRMIAEESGEWSGIVFVDDHAKTKELAGCPVYSFQDFRAQFRPDGVRFVIAIGEPKFRLEAFERMTRAGYTGGRLVHSSAQISPDAEVGEGTAVCQGVFVGSRAKVGRNCYLSLNACIGHDAVVGDHTRLGVNAFVGGREAALCWASLPKPCPASSVRAREGAGCGSVGAEIGRASCRERV